MINRKRIWIIVGCILALTALGIWYPYRPLRHYTASVMKSSDYDLILQFDIPKVDFWTGNLTGNLYRVILKKVDFVSNDPSIVSPSDLKPGMLVKATVKQCFATTESISPSISDLHYVTKIETTDQTNDQLFQEGIAELSENGFDYKNGELATRIPNPFDSLPQTPQWKEPSIGSAFVS